MKILICFLLLFSFTAGYGQTEEETSSHKDAANEDMLIGDCIKADFQDTASAEWFNPEYAEYKVDAEAADSLKGKIDSVEIVIVLGTWCSDSHRELPRFFKILDYLKYPSERIIMKCVDRKLKTLSSDVDIYKVESVPSFLFFREGEEIGRIIEAPDESLEKDMKRIINE